MLCGPVEGLDDDRHLRRSGLVPGGQTFEAIDDLEAPARHHRDAQGERARVIRRQRQRPGPQVAVRRVELVDAHERDRGG